MRIAKKTSNDGLNASSMLSVLNVFCLFSNTVVCWPLNTLVRKKKNRCVFCIILYFGFFVIQMGISPWRTLVGFTRGKPAAAQPRNLVRNVDVSTSFCKDIFFTNQTVMEITVSLVCYLQTVQLKCIN